MDAIALHDFTTFTSVDFRGHVPGMIESHRNQIYQLNEAATMC